MVFAVLQLLSPLSARLLTMVICFPSGMEKMGPVTQKLYDTLTGIQYGKIEAPEGWIHEIM